MWSTAHREIPPPLGARIEVRLGRLWRVEVTLHWAGVLFLMAIGAVLGGVVFPTWHPAWGPWAAAAAAAVTCLLLLGIAQLHEIARAWVARVHGSGVAHDTSFLVAGVGRLEVQPPSPRAEILAALVAPVVSVVLSGLALAVAHLLGPPESGAITAVLTAVGISSLGLAAIGLLPAFPLDGGRAFRAILWLTQGSYVPATLRAMTVSRFVGRLLFALGLAAAVWGDAPAALALAGLGAVVATAQRRARRASLASIALVDTPVEQLMNHAPETVRRSTPISEIAHHHPEYGEPAMYPVVSAQGWFLGLVSVEDARAYPRQLWFGSTVDDLMRGSSDVVLLTPDEPAAGAVLELDDQSLLPIVDHDGRLVGTLARRDVWAWLEHGFTPVEDAA